MITNQATAVDPPPGWQAEQTSDGVDLRVVSQSQRRYVTAGAGVIAALFGLRALIQWNRGAAAGVTPWLALATFFCLFALWMAFADEAWHLSTNQVTHRVGIGAICYHRTYQNADLAIVVGFTKFGKPYYRLRVIADGNYFLLIERPEQELKVLARFIARYTGWRIRES